MGQKMTKDDQASIVKPGMKVDFLHKYNQPKWSPDGRWIAFVSYGGIYRVQPDGTDLQLIIRDGIFPAWSPDGTMLTHVVMSRTLFALLFGRPSDRIFVADIDGSDPTEIALDHKEPSTYEDLNWAE
jgi:Tol biopolymer transport system component